MKYADIQSKSQVELNELLKEFKIKLGKLKFESAEKAVKDSSQFSKLKKDIARVLTLLNSSSKN